MARRQSNGAGRALLISSLALAGVGIGFAVARANRDKLPANRREFVRRYVNPRMLSAVASGKRGNLGIIVHRGRKSGREFQTPVRIDPIPGGFLIPMPYGTGTDWLKNILAAGGATLRFQGQEIAVDCPEILDAESALKLLPPNAQFVAKLLRIKQYLRVRRADLQQQRAAEELRAQDQLP